MPASDPITSLAPGQPLFSPDGHDWSWAYIVHRDIPGFPGYAVGTDGSVWSRRTYGSSGRIDETWHQIRPQPAHGYLGVILRRAGKSCPRRVHRIVMEAFVGPRPVGMECCHGNGNRRDNRWDNLRWDTSVANHADTIRHGRSTRGARASCVKLVESQIPEIRAMAGRGISQRRIGSMLGVSQSAISLIVSGKNWGHVP